MSRKDFDKAVSLLGDHVTSNVEVLEPKDLKVPLLFRLDEWIPKVLVPRMPASHAASENNTVPRVVTATTVFGCMSGHGAMLWLLLDRRIGEPGNNYYKLTAYDFEYALLPNKKLVYDAEDTREAWLIAYDKDTTIYRPLHYGEIFFNQITVIPQGNNKVNTQIADIMVHISDSRGVEWCEGIYLAKGHYHIKADVTNYAMPGGKDMPKRTSYKEKDKFNVTPITPSIYKSLRDIRVTKKG